MKRKMFITILIGLLILSSSCNSDKNSNLTIETLNEKVFPMVFEKEMEKRIDMIAKGGPIFAKINDPDHIYLYAIWNLDKNCEILKMSNDLEIRERYIIKNGNGPGEVRNARFYGGNDHSIILYDNAGHKFIELDSNFKLINEYKDKNSPGGPRTGNIYLPGQRIVVGGYKQLIRFAKTPDLLFEFNIRIFLRKFITDKNEIENIKLFEIPYNELWKNNRTPAFIPDSFGYFFDHIYILDKREYRVIKMDIEGNVLKEKKFAFKSKTFPGSDRAKWVKKFFGEREAKEFDFPEKLFPACWLMPIAGGIAVGQCENYDLDDKGPISADYFDPDLNYLGKITIPYFWAWNQPHQGQDEVYHRFYYRNGKLYFIQCLDDDYRIIVWKVLIEKN